MNSASKSLPPHLHGLILAGIRTGRLPEVMEEYIQMEESQRRIAAAVAVEFGLSDFPGDHHDADGLWLPKLSACVFRKNIQGFSARPFPRSRSCCSPPSSICNGSWSGLVVCLIAIPLLLSDAPGLGWLSPLVYRIPILGTLLKYSRWAMFSRLTAMLLEQQNALARARCD